MVERHYGHLTDSYVSQTIRKTAPTFEVARTFEIAGENNVILLTG